MLLIITNDNQKKLYPMVIYQYAQRLHKTLVEATQQCASIILADSLVCIFQMMYLCSV